MVECRCTNCSKLLGKISGVAEIKCPRCGKLNNIDTEHQTSASPPK